MSLGPPRRRATIGRAFGCDGAGLHTGHRVEMRISPADAGAGVVFRRVVNGRAHDVPALWTNRRSRPLCTALQVDDGPLIRTVEHLMAALTASAIDDVLIEMDGEELPIFDGSAAPWMRLLDEAGRVESAAPRRYLRMLKPVEHRAGVKKLKAAPGKLGFFVGAGITLSHFGKMRWDGVVDRETFARELAPSRSFGRLKWALPAALVGKLFSREPVLRGANHQNTAALWGASAIGGLRFPDEPVRHRALDFIGDLSLVGMPLLGRFTAVRPGHETNYGLVDAVMSTPDAWDVVEIGPDGTPVPVNR